MKKLHLKNWMFTGLNGFLAIVFGLVALLFPTITLIALAIYFAISILIGGLVLTVGSVRIRNENPGWHLILIEGIIGMLIGIIILLRPEVSAAVFVTIIGIWAILLGLIFVTAWYRREMPKSEKGFLLITGILSLIFGLLITINPFEGSRVITVLIGVYAITYGLFSIITNNNKT
ncbi:MAG: DUF308 domain-containing protein [Bacteroidales bacterium]